jgi:hypothetical protein
VGSYRTDFVESPESAMWKLDARGPNGSSAKPGVQPTPSHHLSQPPLPESLVFGSLSLKGL